ncbi:MAG: MFS transporter [Gemmatimonadetes bacterium]|nr:MFS transporter [Gemmatimonadota bacterium]
MTPRGVDASEDTAPPRTAQGAHGGAPVGSAGTGGTGDAGRAWAMLALLAGAELLGMSPWFTGSAVAPQLVARWSLSAAQVGGLSTAVQLGFVLGTALAALLNLADITPARRYFTWAATAAAVANAALVWAPDYPVALATRALTGLCLAGVYPPAMKMAATWFRARRGLAVGAVVGALTVGKAAPYLWRVIPDAGVETVVFASSSAAAVAAILVALFWHDGPFAFPSRRFSWGLVGEVVAAPRWRLATGGYLGHMAELYAYWTWIPAFVAASAVAWAADPAAARSPWVGALSFGTIAVGGLGCLWGGVVSDRVGRERLVILAMALSGVCALAIGFAFGRSPWLLAPLALAWGFFVIADSAQFSVLVTESVPPHAVGTALTVQVCLGFLLTTVTIQMIPPLVAWAGWRAAFALLAVGPALGIVSIRRLQAHARRERAIAPSA